MLYCQVLDPAESIEGMLTVMKLDGTMFHRDFFVWFFAMTSVVMVCLNLLFLQFNKAFVRL